MSGKDAPAAFKATFCGFRSIGSRKQTALTFEVPIEHSERVLKILGHPGAGETRWFAIALLDGEPTDKAQAPSGAVHTKLIQRAGILCNEPPFWAFMKEHTGFKGLKDEPSCADALRIYLDIGSRRDLEHNDEARAKFRDLLASYDAWRYAP